jgi:hypothetical protein
MTETTTTSEHGVGQDTDHRPARQDRPSEVRPRPASRLLNLFGWVMGGLSLVNLVHDLTPLDLYGRLSERMQEQDKAVPPAHIVRREVVGVLSVAVLIVALNYALFHG